MVWLALIGGSLLVGAMCGWYFRGKKAWLLGMVIPWFALLAVILYTEYFVTPEEGGGASMWPIAQLIGGTIAAFFGLIGTFIGRKFARKQ
jgi:hypothetical protein